ncbi:MULTISPECIES: MarR family winged helix-turn-helix transcriptional regulator [Selenomonas]|uniref:MarR family transcriptional regulator n=1 Tax=Selenomonas ruminis TaxID=2593411 RepID=A0A5D6W1Y7_9FIRM|nr:MULTISPECIES: MarR family transcriptional regulator [unclassified Selenomonas]MBQ1868634.1 MarR family transcriptional regulator [Selenomonas sp.]TYZ20795.1 MarR family transcriptional regulator [Selenomonas sp. mPRGC5]
MDDYVNVGRWFSILHRRSQLFIVEACQNLHLTFSEYIMLIRIFDNEGAKQDELANMLYLDKAVVTRTVNLLQEKGFIYREVDPADRRVKHIFLTEYGREQHQFLRNIIQGWIDYLVRDMKQDDIQHLFNGFNELVTKACEADLVKLARNLPSGGDVHEKI